jgi:hypothetical protein
MALSRVNSQTSLYLEQSFSHYFSQWNIHRSLQFSPQDITGSKPASTEGTLAGTTHDLPLKTKYYTATVPIWLDTVHSAEEWASSFLSNEAGEVLAVLGGLLIIFSLPQQSSSDGAAERTRELLRHVGRVVQDGLGGWEWDGVRVAIGVGDGTADDTEEWDELCAEAGMEFVQVGSSGSGGGRESMLQEFGGSFFKSSHLRVHFYAPYFFKRKKKKKKKKKKKRDNQLLT